MTGLPVPIAEIPDLVARTRDGDERAFATLVRSVLDRYDNSTKSQCAVQVRVPPMP